MTTIELQTLLDRVKDEIRIFERPSADNSRKMFDLLTEAIKNNGVLPLVSNLLDCDNCKYENSRYDKYCNDCINFSKHEKAI